MFQAKKLSSDSLILCVRVRYSANLGGINVGRSVWFRFGGREGGKSDACVLGNDMEERRKKKGPLRSLFGWGWQRIASGKRRCVTTALLLSTVKKVGRVNGYKKNFSNEDQNSSITYLRYDFQQDLLLYYLWHFFQPLGTPLFLALRVNFASRDASFSVFQPTLNFSRLCLCLSLTFI